MNFIAITQFFIAIYIGIFEHLLATGSKNGDLLRPVLSYFRIIKTNSQSMLHLHCLVWLCEAFHLSKICNQLCLDSTYTAKTKQCGCYIAIHVWWAR